MSKKKEYIELVGEHFVFDSSSNQIKLAEYSDYFKLFGVAPAGSTDQAELKKTYKKLSLLSHADKNKEFHAEDVFKIVAIAYKALQDKTKKLDRAAEIKNTFEYFISTLNAEKKTYLSGGEVRNLIIQNFNPYTKYALMTMNLGQIKEQIEQYQELCSRVSNRSFYVRDYLDKIQPFNLDMLQYFANKDISQLTEEDFSRIYEDKNLSDLIVRLLIENFTRNKSLTNDAFNENLNKLFSKGMTIELSAINEAVKQENIVALKAVLRSLCAMNPLSILDSPMCIATNIDHLDAVKLLIKNGGTLDEVDQRRNKVAKNLIAPNGKIDAYLNNKDKEGLAPAPPIQPIVIPEMAPVVIQEIVKKEETLPVVIAAPITPAPVPAPAKQTTAKAPTPRNPDKFNTMGGVVALFSGLATYYLISGIKLPTEITITLVLIAASIGYVGVDDLPTSKLESPRNPNPASKQR